MIDLDSLRQYTNVEILGQSQTEAAEAVEKLIGEIERLRDICCELLTSTIGGEKYGLDESNVRGMRQRLEKAIGPDKSAKVLAEMVEDGFEP